MCHRYIQEKLEDDLLSVYGTRSVNTRGREFKEEECLLRTAFQRDRDRILHSKAFRRLAHKTQVFISPEGDHYRTRLTHTLEVAQIARTLARALQLNEDLVEAIALGHDLGHTPFGHSGEEVLKKLTRGSFSHNEQSLRIVEKLEDKGSGLNLTYEVREGILHHQSKSKTETLESRIVQLSDKIAYVNHDIDDALRGQVLKESDLPKDCIELLGNRSSERIHNLIMDIISFSKGNNFVTMSKEVEAAFLALRKFLFQNVYIDSAAKQEEIKAKHVVEELFIYYMKYPDKLPAYFWQEISNGEAVERIVCDYIAGMTDRFAVHQYCELFFPTAWKVY
ncbi:MAG: deoxyguanosinetriphosphate triphosphohydrolase [Cellulosilyticaceae bacterium]